MQYGLIGKPLGHSISPLIHDLLGNPNYELREIDEEDLEEFLLKKEFKGINVTIPYKQKVIPYLDFIDEKAKRIGAVNTIVNKDGKLYGYNTDYDGFKELLMSSKINVKDKNVLILGTGGTSKTTSEVLKDMNAKSIKYVSRSSNENKLSYEEALKETNTNIIVNTTPVGMYPNCSKYPLSLLSFNNLEAVVDVIYNPLNTRLVLFAKKRNIKGVGGLRMLVAQAIKAHELFFDTFVLEQSREEIYITILKKVTNIVLIGMPGSGKSTIARYLAKEFDRELIDLDKEIENYEGKLIKDIFKDSGEEYFRKVETKVTKYHAKKHGVVISTGGGVIKKTRNIEMLRQNGLIFYINRDVNLLEALHSDKRPLAKTKGDLINLYQERNHLYKKYAHIIVENNGLFLKCGEKVKEVFDEIHDY